MPESNLSVLLALWLSVCIVLLWLIAVGKIPSAGLIPAYLVNLALLHFFGAAIFLLPAYEHVSRTMMELGFVQSLWGVTSFAVGAMALEPSFRRMCRRLYVPPLAVADPRLPRMYSMTGAILYFGVWPIIGRVPTLSALFASMFSLLVVGLALWCWKAWNDRRPLILGLAVGCALSLPFVTILTQGFLGYGVGACLIVLLFVAGFYRPRWHVVAGGLILFYVALSFYVTYMRDRDALREVMWGTANITDRLETLYGMIGNIELFDPYNEFHLWLIDIRLNQNNLVGAAVDYLGNGYKDLAYGATLWEAVLALVPRALWPDKPVFGGSGDLVTQFTGIVFAEGTSIGIGQVMEFYVNFGTAGVILGFVVLGVLVAAIDRAMAERLPAGDWQGFAFWFMPGIALLNVGGSLVEVTGTFGASMLAICIINKFLNLGFLGRAQSEISSRRGQGAPVVPV